MANSKRGTYTYGIDFDINKTKLESLKKSLNEISSIT
jgi:hypothetical protein